MQARFPAVIQIIALSAPFFLNLFAPYSGSPNNYLPPPATYLVNSSAIDSLRRPDSDIVANNTGYSLPNLYVKPTNPNSFKCGQLEHG